MEEWVAADEQELRVKRAKKLAKALAMQNPQSHDDYLKRAVRCLSIAAARDEIHVSLLISSVQPVSRSSALSGLLVQSGKLRQKRAEADASRLEAEAVADEGARELAAVLTRTYEAELSAYAGRVLV